MGVPSRAGAPTPTLIRTCMGFRSCSGGTPHSRHPAEGHPQVLIIAHLAFLTNELARTGWHWPSGAPSLCTLEESFYFQPHLDRRRLADCCWAAGVHLTDAHSALGDARAAAQLFSAFVRTSPSAPIDRGYDRLLRTAVATPWPNQPGVPVVFPVAPPSRQRSAPVQRNVAAAARTRSTPPLLEAFTLSDALDEGGTKLVTRVPGNDDRGPRGRRASRSRNAMRCQNWSSSTPSPRPMLRQRIGDWSEHWLERRSKMDV